LAAGWTGPVLPGDAHPDTNNVPSGFQRRIFFIDAAANPQTFIRLQFTLQPANDP
jgi:hypothetical protein